MKIKVTAYLVIELPPHATIIEDMVSDNEHMGPHVHVDGKLFCPFIEWSEFVPAQSASANGDIPRSRHGYIQSEADDDDRYFSAPHIVHHEICVLTD